MYNIFSVYAMYLFAFFCDSSIFFRLMELSQASLTEKQSSQSRDTLTPGLTHTEEETQAGHGIH